MRQGLPLALPADVRVRLVHAPADDIVPVDDVRRVAAANAGGPVDLVEVDDDHALTSHVQRGALVEWVDDLVVESGFGPRLS